MDLKYSLFYLELSCGWILRRKDFRSSWPWCVGGSISGTETDNSHTLKKKSEGFGWRVSQFEWKIIVYERRQLHRHVINNSLRDRVSQLQKVIVAMLILSSVVTIMRSPGMCACLCLVSQHRSSLDDIPARVETGSNVSVRARRVGQLSVELTALKYRMQSCLKCIFIWCLSVVEYGYLRVWLM